MRSWKSLDFSFGDELFGTHAVHSQGSVESREGKWKTVKHAEA